MGPNLTQAEGFILGVGAKMFSCCGARQMSSATVCLRPLPTAVTRSGRLTPPPAALPSLPIAGPVIVYGVSASVVYGLIYWITTLF